MRQSKFFTARQGDGGAQHASGMFQHEIHLLGGYLLGCNDQVTLVLAVFVVNHDDEIAGLEFLNGLFNRI